MDDQVDVYICILVVLYSLLALISFFQIGRLRYYRHKIFSYQMGFLICVLIWTVLRGIFFSMSQVWNNVDYEESDDDVSIKIIIQDILFWTPYLIEFSAYTLLVVFYAKCIHKKNWKKVKKYAWALFLIINLSFIVFLIVYLILNYYYLKKLGAPPNWVGATAQAYSGIIFIVLVFFLAYFGASVFLHVRQQKIAVPFQLRGASNNIIIISTFLIVIVFLSRSIYDFITAAGIGLVTVSQKKDGKVILPLYVLWEIIPAATLVVIFWSIPGRSNKREPGRPSLNSNTSDLNDNVESEFFNNDTRYDSDEYDPYGGNFITPYATSAKQ